MLLRILGILFPVFAVTAAGYAYGYWKRPNMTAANQLNMEVFTPALIFWVLADKPFDIGQYLGLSLGAIVIVLGSGLLLLPALPLLKTPLKTFLPPMMFNNGGNMGIPLALYAFGEAALQAAVVLFIIGIVLHLTVGIYILDHRAHFLKIFRMPIIIATIAGLGFSLTGLSLPEPLSRAIEMVGQISIPLMLFSLGVRLTDVDLKDWRIGFWGAILCPLSGVGIALALQPFLDLTVMQINLLLLYGALPPAVMNFIIAEQYAQEPQKVASIVMLGHLGSLIAIPAVLFFTLIP